MAEPQPKISFADTAADPEWPARRALAAGDREGALKVLMGLHGAAVHRYCAALLGDEAQADDLLQTVFFAAFQHLADWQGRSSLRTWLLGIARHRCLDELRRKRRWRSIFRPWTGAETAASGPSRDDDADAPALKANLEQCLERLSPESRDSVLLRFREELSYEDASIVTGDAPATLRVRVCRAMVALRRCLERKGVLR